MTEPTTPCAPALDPCPFCGADGENLGTFCEPDLTECSARRIQCFGCTVEAPFYPSEEEAIAAWNRRPAPTRTDALAAQQAVMRQALDALVLLDDAFCADDYGTREGRIRGRKALTNSRAAVASLRAALSATQEKPHD